MSTVSALTDVGTEEYDGLSRHIFYATTLGREKGTFAFETVVPSSPSESYSMT
jgi:hypothetical protein